MNLDDLVVRMAKDAHRYGEYEQRAARPKDLRVVVGPKGDGLLVHGSGWGAYSGFQPSPVVPSDESNPFGAAFAVIMAAAQLQRNPHLTGVKPTSVDTYLWREGLPSPGTPRVTPDFELGELWTIGVGSVGSCALFFLALITRAFSGVLVDRDLVKVENVTRSALFSWLDALAEVPKVEVASRWLQGAGVEQVEAHPEWLDEIARRWNERQAGTPDILISAANERGVRSMIEGVYPPVQVYGTTGRNWQATLFRHVPLVDACSRCVPGEEGTPLPAPCATGCRSRPLVVIEVTTLRSRSCRTRLAS